MHPLTQLLISPVQQMLHDAYKRILPQAAIQLGLSEADATRRIKLQLTLRSEITAEVQTLDDTITVSFGLILFLHYMISLFLSHIDESDRPTKDLHLKSSRAFMMEFWQSGGHMTDGMERAGMDILHDFANSRHLPFANALLEYVICFVVAHEFGHIISQDRKRMSAKVPCHEVANYFAFGLRKEGLVQHFGRYTGTPEEMITALWVEELCADGTALDLCGSLNSEAKWMGARLLSPEELAGLSDEFRDRICNAYALQISADLFFLVMHILDVFFARAFKAWVPFKTHPPSVTRLIFSRCVFRPPEVKVSRVTKMSYGAGGLKKSDETEVMINFSSALFGGLFKLTGGNKGPSPIALSRLTNQKRNDIILGRLCEYLHRAYDGGDACGAEDLRIADIVIHGDPVFRSDRVLAFGNIFCELADNLMAEVFAR